MKMPKSSPEGQKTLWEKEKLLVMSNFFFSLSVFKRLLQQTFKNQGLFGEGLSVFIMNFHSIEKEAKKMRKNKKYCLPVFSLQGCESTELFKEMVMS